MDIDPKAIRIPDKLYPREFAGSDKPNKGVNPANSGYKALVCSIREHGLRNPVFVNEHVDGKVDLVEGYWRLRAALDAGAKRVPSVCVNDVSECQIAELVGNEGKGLWE